MSDLLPEVFICSAIADNESKNRLERWLDRLVQYFENGATIGMT